MFSPHFSNIRRTRTTIYSVGEGRFQIPGYDCVAQGKSSSERGGLITYVDNIFHYEVRQSINEYEFWEGQIIQVKGGCYVKKLL